MAYMNQISVWILPLLFAITLHEAAHAFAARALGDDTASKLGRLSLNPMKHIDPFGNRAASGPSVAHRVAISVWVRKAGACQIPCSTSSKSRYDTGRGCRTADQSGPCHHFCGIFSSSGVPAVRASIVACREFQELDPRQRISCSVQSVPDTAPRRRPDRGRSPPANIGTAIVSAGAVRSASSSYIAFCSSRSRDKNGL